MDPDNVVICRHDSKGIPGELYIPDGNLVAHQAFPCHMSTPHVHQAHGTRNSDHTDLECTDERYVEVRLLHTPRKIERF